VRAFVAVFPPPEIRAAALARALETVRDPGERMRWIKPENVHLTLKFLGNIREEVLDDLCGALEETCERYAPFDVGVMGLGAFPSTRRARILWAGVGVGSERLSALAMGIDAALVPLGFQHEKRPYTPHLTLGRMRGRPASLDLSQDTEEFGSFRLRRVELTESTLSAEGAVYRPVQGFVLRE
jgi:RNA 2',3'-cyclic 3'-phosphodiesterase